MSQRQLAEETGKSEGEISKLLSLLKDLSPEVQRQVARAGSNVSKRHLLAVARLPALHQEETLGEVRRQNLTVAETEMLVSKSLPRRGTRSIAPPRITKFQYTCGPATVTITFRRSQVAAADVLEALDAAKSQATLVKPEVQIIRAKH
jgi:ParB-like chromosome segregation protein Spo0J